MCPGNHRDLLLTQDGQLGYEVLSGDRIEISLSRSRKIDVIELSSRSYFDLLEENFGGGRGLSPSKRSDRFDRGNFHK